VLGLVVALASCRVILSGPIQRVAVWNVAPILRITFWTASVKWLLASPRLTLGYPREALWDELIGLQKESGEAVQFVVSLRIYPAT